MGAIKEFKELFISDARRYLNNQEFERIEKGGLFRCYAMSRKATGLRFSF